MNARTRGLLVAIVLLAGVVACRSEAAVLTGDEPGTTAARAGDLDPDAPIALVETDAGLAGVPIGSSVPRWVAPGAVAAPDGSAIFATENEGEATVTTRIWRLDPRTGFRTSVGERVVPGGQPMHAFAVEPGGGRVALAMFQGGQTIILPFDPATGGPTAKPAFEGHLEPEAFSLDRQRMYASRSYGDHYQVTTLDLVRALQYPTIGYDKAAPPEDMYGNVIQAVLTADGRRLATLYRDPGHTDHTAFVHLLDLENGLTVCVDLYAPFGTGGAGTDAIRANADGTLDVGHRDPGAATGLRARIDPQAILSAVPEPHYHAAAIPDADAPTVPEGVAQTPGFKRFVAIAK